MLQSIGLVEVLVVCFLLLLFLGAKRLPMFGRGLGEAKTEFKKSVRDDESKVKNT